MSVDTTRAEVSRIVTAGRTRVIGEATKRYLRHLGRAAWGHLDTLSCCETLLDAIGHVTREDGKCEEKP